ncbi:nuclease-related domain-containing protein [Ammoniphilus sp. CFH 90114]|uniref:nuclease-related domain-containing protein n=1 Tax=Ammoniphilus sp. CFH 90114 TaxID=2493665 RepID=UPI00100E50E3|nr:nuclease-related domain-containing protein [Ammoniphilus sp. CFH 90114]RXT04053.1 NERD domain-containing protein [Ammoniphilus sp. CFH 90114]
MLLKSRSESDELIARRFLNTRMELAEREKFNYLNLEKGYEGELKFDNLIANLQEERYIINDLLLEVNNSYFQIDSLIISQGVIYLLDIKNFHGDFYFESDKFYALLTGREYKNPVNQLKRSETLFNQLLQNLKQNFLVEASLIFINPEFTLYQAPMNLPIIFPNQVNRFINDLNNTPSKLSDGHKKLAQQLLSLHQTKNPYTKVPDYNYEQLQKGIYCKSCMSFLVSKKNANFVCEICGVQETLRQTIVRSIEEFKILFPNRKITTQSIHDWCKVDLHRKTLSRILKEHYTTFGTTRDTYYK